MTEGRQSDIRILVSGGSGRLASVLSLVGGDRVQALSRAELDISDAFAFQAALARLKPDVVINVAAIASLEACERTPERAQAINALAPGQMARACAQAGTPFIQISTDYVFGAPTHRPWRESDPVSPVNLYGELKAEAERQVLAAGGEVCIARVAWLFGDGKDFIAHLLRGQDDSVRIARDQIGSPTPIVPLAGRLLDLAERMAAREPIPRLLHLTGSPAVSRADWVATAFDALRRAGRRTPELVPVPMSDLGSSVVRPHYSALDSGLAAELFGGELDWRAVAMQVETFAERPASS
ncbi:dTDP-4-dehydrorhamnose reductase [Bosea sp. 62]|uniref:SDR family oxidoreductase n=1 Tax=unclassified Bosea (in: a-proteobacteria) TaxID=2653178 RepID=UPI00125B32B0|nr:MULTISPECIES: sugar nucleotide-binding protein [unclassified Bosea (in: a-proteobacteria)]CAD5251877.1 dTDP-4-dehydrorhamnose reductase [Bosea sp. 21B]CAD5261311.1 dTDP-4-dehydrorhamnose reductase [Bosea sp. 7B]CAD5273376.1 dTDP-4-dehydrorhamnose reductase [Bosea sp. 46]VVT43426.1 dTDP-4-dehydrorhamnose reductase [Bosea sp. EC-HK365B]VXB27207.1 dTDP-4-dehydrorhamnose reductase [Bosea sp. 29B]